ncbi:MAG: hypothetical protein ACFN4D_05660 [Cardiobacterium sp.]
MQKIHFLYNFIIVLAALITCAIAGEFYLSTLLIMLPVYYLAYVVYLTVNYRKMANRAAFPFKGLRLLLASFVIYLAAFAATLFIYQRINQTVATEMQQIEPCPVHGDCSTAVVLTYRNILEKRFFLTRDNRCIHLRSPGYALVKTELDYCREETR